jgi:hypothetical protein
MTAFRQIYVAIDQSRKEEMKVSGTPAAAVSAESKFESENENTRQYSEG